jgi:energy-coupling factor transport system ATP-binding protein
LHGDVSSFRLNAPFVVRFARESGWREIPLSVGEAAALARAHGTLIPPARRDGARAASLDAPRVVEMREVSFALGGREILRNVHLDLSRGECIALVGQSGSGKTTLLKHLNGLYRPSRGSVTVLSQDTRRARMSDLARHVGLVFQNPNDQFFKPNVCEEIEVAPRALHCFDGAWIEKLLDWFELRPLLGRSPFTLSEGEKKRVTFVAALAAHPEIVALDEPTTGQDWAFRTALTTLLHELQSEGLAVILATHDLEFADQVAPRWIALADGEIVADATPDEAMANTEAMARAALRPTARFELQQALAQRAQDAVPQAE